MKIQAQVIQDVGDWQRDRIRLALREERYDGERYLLSDGTWSEESGRGEIAKVPDGLEIGLPLPEAALEEIVQAIERHKGATVHGPTAEKLLRETLEIERGRVDRLIDRALEPEAG